MSLLELKSDIYRLVEETEDSQVLEIIQSLLSNPSSQQKEAWNDIGEYTKKSIERGLEDIKNGKVHNAWEVLKK
jgi:hypothetical protein